MQLYPHARLYSSPYNEEFETDFSHGPAQRTRHARRSAAAPQRRALASRSFEMIVRSQLLKLRGGYCFSRSLYSVPSDVAPFRTLSNGASRCTAHSLLHAMYKPSGQGHQLCGVLLLLSFPSLFLAPPPHTTMPQQQVAKRVPWR